MFQIVSLGSTSSESSFSLSFTDFLDFQFSTIPNVVMPHSIEDLKLLSQESWVGEYKLEDVFEKSNPAKIMEERRRVCCEAEAIFEIQSEQTKKL